MDKEVLKTDMRQITLKQENVTLVQILICIIIK